MREIEIYTDRMRERGVLVTDRQTKILIDHDTQQKAKMRIWQILVQIDRKQILNTYLENDMDIEKERYMYIVYIYI